MVNTIGASVSTYSPLVAGSIMLAGDKKADPKLARTIAANASVHAEQLFDAVNTGFLNQEDVETTLSHGKSNTSRGESPPKPGSIPGLADGLDAGNGRVVGGKGLIHRLEKLGYEEDDYNAHKFAGKRRLIDVEDSLSVQAAIEAAESGERDPRWAMVPKESDLPVGRTPIIAKHRPSPDDSIDVAGLPARRQGFPDPNNYGVTQRVEDEWQIRFSSKSFKEFQKAVSSGSAGDDKVPLWARAIEDLAPDESHHGGADRKISARQEDPESSR